MAFRILPFRTLLKSSDNSGSPLSSSWNGGSKTEIGLGCSWFSIGITNGQDFVAENLACKMLRTRVKRLPKLKTLELMCMSLVKKT